MTTDARVIVTIDLRGVTVDTRSGAPNVEELLQKTLGVALADTARVAGWKVAKVYLADEDHLSALDTWVAKDRL